MSTSERWSTATVAAVASASILAGVLIKHLRDRQKSVVITLPSWIHNLEAEMKDKIFTTDEDMMKVAVAVSEKNVMYQTGGPFGTAIFAREKASGTSKLLALGANRVVPLTNSVLHGETTAIQFAEKKLKRHSLASTETHDYILCTSCEPCCMCLGSVLWSGVAFMYCSATKADAEKIGFNEGPVFPESYKSLEAAGIKVKFNILQEEGAKVLRRYGETGVIY